MNLRELEYLKAVAEHRHFGKAAFECFVSQPTLSGQIKKLEEELGVTIFERGRRGVLLTQEGKEIVQQARKVLSGVQELQQMAESFRDPFRGALRLGIFPTLSPYLLPHIVGRLHQEFPELRLLLVEDQTHRIEKQLLDGELDVLVLALPVENPVFEVQELFAEPFRMALPKEHDLARKKQVGVADLEGLSMLLLEDGHCLRAQVLDVCNTTGASEFSGFRASSLETLRQMVAAGTGITLIPELAVRRDLSAKGNIKYLPFKNPQPHRKLGLVWRKGSTRTQLFDKLAEIIRSEAEQALA